MNNRQGSVWQIMLTIAAALAANAVFSQTAQDELPPGVVAVEPGAEQPAYTAEQLAELVGPIALYPDDLVAIVLPASTYPLQLVQAARFLERLEDDPSLEPDPEWDESIVALLNYPEVVKLLNEDLDWTWRLGEAVLARQSDVIEAIERFRDRAWLAGNLRSDERQVVSREAGVVKIVPADPEVIYVPYYEPRRVVYYSPLPVYHYYPYRYPSYYYPYPAGYSFASGYFWGVTSAFAIGWHTHHLHVHHYGYRSHPYYGRSYYRQHYYRRPVVNSYYRRPAYRDRHLRHHAGNYWRPRNRRGARPHHYRGNRRADSDYRARRPRADGNPPRLAPPRDSRPNRNRNERRGDGRGLRDSGGRNRIVANNRGAGGSRAAPQTTRANPRTTAPGQRPDRRSTGVNRGRRDPGDAGARQGRADDAAGRAARNARPRSQAGTLRRLRPTGSNAGAPRLSGNNVRRGNRAPALNTTNRAGGNPVGGGAPTSNSFARAPDRTLAGAARRSGAGAGAAARPAGENRIIRHTPTPKRMAAPRLSQPRVAPGTNRSNRGASARVQTRPRPVTPAARSSGAIRSSSPRMVRPRTAASAPRSSPSRVVTSAPRASRPSMASAPRRPAATATPRSQPSSQPQRAAREPTRRASASRGGARFGARQRRVR